MLAAMKSAGSGIHNFILEMNNALRLGLNQPVKLSNLNNLYKKLYLPFVCYKRSVISCGIDHKADIYTKGCSVLIT